MATENRGANINKIIATLEGGPFFTRQQVAQIMRVSPDSLRRWMKRPGFPLPHHHVIFGKTRVVLFKAEDISTVVDWANKTIAGANFAIVYK